MGIKSLWSYLTDKHPSVFKYVPQRSFRGLRIAFDMGGWVFPMRAQLRSRMIKRTDVIDDAIDEAKIDDQWLAVILERLTRFIVLGITPILVFDGPSPPEKTATKLSRTQKNEKVLDDISKLREEIAELEGTDALTMLEERPKLLEQLQNLMVKISYIPADSMRLIRIFFQDIGIPTFEATGEAERAAAALCREGIAAAAFSPDGDTLAHGCPILIRDVGREIFDDEGKAQPTFEIVYLRDIIEALDISETKFVHLCILCGCDYNTNMKGVGIVGSLKLVHKYGKISKIKGHDLECLNHEACLELFSHVAALDQIPGGKLRFEIRSPDELTYESFESYRMVMYRDRYMGAAADIEPPRDYVHLSYTDMGDFVIEDEGDVLAGVALLPKDQRSSQLKTAARRGRGGRGRGRGGARAASSS